MSSRPTLLVVIGSVREGRIGAPIAEWFVEQARVEGSFEVVVQDLKDLPMMDEPKHPRLVQYTHDHTKAWSRRVAGADAVVWVTPEYNYSMAGSVKNAIDYLLHEWRLLPTGFVSYGGMSGGTRGVEHAKIPLTCVGASIVGATVAVPSAPSLVKGGVFTPSEITAKSVEPLLKDLMRTHVRNREDRATALRDAGVSA